METSQNILGMLSGQLANAVERVGPALVLVNGRQRLPASGVVFDHELIITADHVLEREEDLSIETHADQTMAAQFCRARPGLRSGGAARAQPGP
ncbi:MAG: hypothetical protein HC893_15730, partial [Chloroflexaceae bacterium]|nr:hypothetical protein [Chloroflexaceae bacterium]